MGKIRPIREDTPQYTADNPEDGRFWHALSRRGRELFDQGSTDFGTVSAEAAGTPFQGRKLVKCRPDRAGIQAWLPSDGAILAIPKDCLKEGDWLLLGSAGDIHVKAEAAQEHGAVWPEPEPESDPTSNGQK